MGKVFVGGKAYSSIQEAKSQGAKFPEKKKDIVKITSKDGKTETREVTPYSGEVIASSKTSAIILGSGMTKEFNKLQEQTKQEFAKSEYSETKPGQIVQKQEVIQQAKQLTPQEINQKTIASIQQKIQSEQARYDTAQTGPYRKEARETIRSDAQTKIEYYKQQIARIKAGESKAVLQEGGDINLVDVTPQPTSYIKSNNIIYYTLPSVGTQKVISGQSEGLYQLNPKPLELYSKENLNLMLKKDTEPIGESILKVKTGKITPADTLVGVKYKEPDVTYSTVKELDTSLGLPKGIKKDNIIISSPETRKVVESEYLKEKKALFESFKNKNEMYKAGSTFEFLGEQQSKKLDTTKNIPEFVLRATASEGLKQYGQVLKEPVKSGATIVALGLAFETAPVIVGSGLLAVSGYEATKQQTTPSRRIGSFVGNIGLLGIGSLLTKKSKLPEFEFDGIQIKQKGKVFQSGETKALIIEQERIPKSEYLIESNYLTYEGKPEIKIKSSIFEKVGTIKTYQTQEATILKLTESYKRPELNKIYGEKTFIITEKLGNKPEVKVFEKGKLISEFKLEESLYKSETQKGKLKEQETFYGVEKLSDKILIQSQAKEGVLRLKNKELVGVYNIQATGKLVSKVEPITIKKYRTYGSDAKTEFLGKEIRETNIQISKDLKKIKEQNLYETKETGKSIISKIENVKGGIKETLDIGVEGIKIEKKPSQKIFSSSQEFSGTIIIKPKKYIEPKIDVSTFFNEPNKFSKEYNKINVKEDIIIPEDFIKENKKLYEPTKNKKELKEKVTIKGLISKTETQQKPISIIEQKQNIQLSQPETKIYEIPKSKTKSKVGLYSKENRIINTKEKSIQTINVKPQTNFKLDTKIEPKTETKTDTKIINIQSFKPSIKSEFKIDSKVEQRIDTKLDNKLEQKVEQKIEQKIDTKLETKLEQKIQPKIEQKIKLEIKPVIKPKIETPQFKISKQLPSTKPKKESSVGFDVFVRKAGKFERVTIKPLSKEQALQFGAEKVGTSASATFKLQESKSTELGVYKGKGALQDFYKTKEGLYIEKLGRRIKSQGELQEITYKGLATLRSRGKSKGYGFA